MEPGTWLVAVAAGTAIGASGLLPGLHINTLVVLAFGAPWTGPPLAVAFVAAAVAHSFFAVLPATYVGVPGDDAALSVLPAQAMTRAGRGSEAVRVGLDAVLLATLVAVPILWPAKWLLGEPVRLGLLLNIALPWIIAVVLILLLVGERRKGWTAVAWAALVQAAAGALGILTSHVHTAGIIAIPAAQLLPLFAGLFGVAGLIASLASTTGRPEQALPSVAGRLHGRLGRAAVRGVLAATCTVAIPGLTPGVGATLAYGRDRDDPRPAIAALCATSAAHQLLAVGLLFVTQSARTGLAAGVAGALNTPQWTSGRPPTAMLDLLLAALVAAVAAWWLAGRLDGPVRRLLALLPHRAPEWAALVFVVALTAALTGIPGLLLLAVAATIGLLPIAVGTRRVQLVACVAIPALVARAGLTL